MISSYNLRIRAYKLAVRSDELVLNDENVNSTNGKRTYIFFFLMMKLAGVTQFVASQR